MAFNPLLLDNESILKLLAVNAENDRGIMRLVLLEWYKGFSQKHYALNAKSCAKAFDLALVELAIDVKVRRIRVEEISLSRRLQQIMQKHLFEIKMRQLGRTPNFRQNW